MKLVGCCLEHEVQLLVYEYVSNRTLLHHLHDEGYVSTISWENHIRIAGEISEALVYMHSNASTAIIQSDIKPGNILLDENYRAVVFDLLLSKAAPLAELTLQW